MEIEFCERRAAQHTAITGEGSKLKKSRQILLMPRNHCLKHLLFKYYALLAAGGFVGGVLLFAWEILNLPALGAAAVGVVTFAFGVQKQQLEELRLFKDLFERFNARFDDLKKNLNHIFSEQQFPEKPFNEDERDVLFNYFNLCGEEYFYFDKGFIYPEVWKSWENGMKFFRANPRIKKLWDEELRTGSYYGLGFDD